MAIVSLSMLFLVVLTCLVPSAKLWLPLEAVLRLASLMLLGWSYGETNDLRRLSSSLARLPVPHAVRSTLTMAAAVVPAIRTEATHTVEALRLRLSESPGNRGPEGRAKLLRRSILVFVARMFMRADEMAEVASLRGLERPEKAEAGTHQPRSVNAASPVDDVKRGVRRVYNPPVVPRPVLEVRSLSCRYAHAGKRVLKGISFSVTSGEFVCITGKSGSGKSTLARCLVGILPKVFSAEVSGDVTIDGQLVAGIPTWRVGTKAGVVLQGPDSQLLTHTPEEEVAFSLQHALANREEIEARTLWALGAVGATPFRDRPVRTLSAGQRQRSVIAAALARRPKLLILDEPFSMLDPNGVEETLHVLAELHRRHGITIVLFEHRVQRVLSLATRLIVLEDGSIAYDGIPERATEESFLERYGLRSNACLRAQFENRLRGGRPAPDTTAVDAKELMYEYPGGHAVFRGLSFELPAGSTLIVEGENGAGKSTLLKLLTGILNPTCGEIRLGGEHIASLPLSSLTRLVGYVPQIPYYLFTQETVRAEIERSCRLNDGGRPDVDTILGKYDLLHAAHQHPLTLSGGEARRLAMAMAASKGPSLLLLDEPTVGMDGAHLSMFLDLIGSLQGQGMGIMLASNDTELLSLPFSGRVRLINRKTT